MPVIHPVSESRSSKGNIGKRGEGVCRGGPPGTQGASVKNLQGMYITR